MASSQIQICNMALVHLGQRTITSIDEASEPARKMKLVWDSTRDEVLADGEWAFATKTEALAVVSGATSIEWDYVYQQPARCLKVRKLLNESTVDGSEDTPYEKVLLTATNSIGIATDLEDAYIKYTYQVTDPTLFDPAFVKSLSLKLAADTAMALTGDINKRNQMLQYYSASLESAKLVNSGQKKDTPDDSSSFLDAR